MVPSRTWHMNNVTTTQKIRTILKAQVPKQNARQLLSVSRAERVTSPLQSRCGHQVALDRGRWRTTRAARLASKLPKIRDKLFKVSLQNESTFWHKVQPGATRVNRRSKSQTESNKSTRGKNRVFFPTEPSNVNVYCSNNSLDTTTVTEQPTLTLLLFPNSQFRVSFSARLLDVGCKRRYQKHNGFFVKSYFISSLRLSALSALRRGEIPPDLVSLYMRVSWCTSRTYVQNAQNTQRYSFRPPSA